MAEAWLAQSPAGHRLFRGRPGRRYLAVADPLSALCERGPLPGQRYSSCPIRSSLSWMVTARARPPGAGRRSRLLGPACQVRARRPLVGGYPRVIVCDCCWRAGGSAGSAAADRPARSTPAVACPRTAGTALNHGSTVYQPPRWHALPLRRHRRCGAWMAVVVARSGRTGEGASCRAR